MPQFTSSAGISVFGQLISILPHKRISDIVTRRGSDRHVKKFTTRDHLIVMLFAALCGCNALREIESGIAGYHTRLLHLGLRSLPKRSTLSDANANRDSKVFEDIFNVVYKHIKPFLPDSYPGDQKWMEKLFLVDSTTITLFKNILKACGNPGANGKRKGGIKIHVGMRLSESTPSVVCITSAATNDKKFMHNFKNVEPGTILVFDKAYINYEIYNYWSRCETTFVTRLHRRSVVETVQELVVNKQQQALGIYREQIVELGHSGQKEKVSARLIYFYDKGTGRVLKFITNDFKMEASQIAEIYKQRWQVELLFKRLKQNLQLSSFIGDNENAIRIQIWCNLIADILLTVIRKGMKRTRAYSNVASLVRIHLMNYVNIHQLLANPGNQNIFNQNHQDQQLLLKLHPPPGLLFALPDPIE